MCPESKQVTQETSRLGKQLSDSKARDASGELRGSLGAKQGSRLRGSAWKPSKDPVSCAWTWVKLTHPGPHCLASHGIPPTRWQGASAAISTEAAVLSMRRALRKHWAEGFHLSSPIEIATKPEHEMLRESESFSECPLYHHGR